MRSRVTTRLGRKRPAGGRTIVLNGQAEKPGRPLLSGSESLPRLSQDVESRPGLDLLSFRALDAKERTRSHSAKSDSREVRRFRRQLSRIKAHEARIHEADLE